MPATNDPSPAIQQSFTAGEWSPALNARVDLAKYHTGAALLRNFYVDYRGGASTRPGTKYILQAYKSATAVRLIPFTASTSVSYMLEFGDLYIRFYNSGAPVLESSFAITGATKANPCVLTIVGNNYSSLGPDWIYVEAVAGMTQLNGRYFRISNVAGSAVTIADLNGVAINSTAYGTYTSGGTAKRVYTVASPYSSANLATLKFAQNVNTLILCHPSYNAYVLTIISAASWTILPIAYGATISPPVVSSIATTYAAGSANVGYAVTSVDFNGQESTPAYSSKNGIASPLSNAGTNTLALTTIAGAQYYNVYSTRLNFRGAPRTTDDYGFIGYTYTTAFDDTGLNPAFDLSPPITRNPFLGGSVRSLTITAAGVYTAVPTITIAAPSTGTQATGALTLGALTAVISAGGINYALNEIILFANGQFVQVTAVGINGVITAVALTNPGAVTSGSTPANPVAQFSSGGVGTGASVTFTWGVSAATVVIGGQGYSAAPAVTVSSGAASFLAVIDSANVGNPSVPAYFQQRLVLAGPTGAPQSFYMSQPGQYYNFNVSNPIQDDDSISGAIVSSQLNTIKSMIAMPTGLIIFGDRNAWLINGGGQGVGVTPANVVANSQSFNGANDTPPIVANNHILYVQAKGSKVRDLAYDFNTNIFTGGDITIYSSHMFYGYTISEWAWAEEPFFVAWAVRSDGKMLTLTFMKEQEVVAWALSDTNGLYKSVATIPELTSTAGTVDAVYNVAQRVINGNTVKYIERFAERIFPNGATSAWCVDAGLQYSGTATTSFTGGEHLAGATVTGLADGVVIPAFTMPTNGAFTLTTAASVVTVGLAFTPQLQTLAIDLGEPTVQSKTKKIVDVTLRVQETLGLSIGSTSTNLVTMKDLIVGNVGGMTNSVVTGLVTGDAKTVIDPKWNVPGQYFIEQPYPLPATILGVIPNVTVGDTK